MAGYRVYFTVQHTDLNVMSAGYLDHIASMPPQNGVMKMIEDDLSRAVKGTVHIHEWRQLEDITRSQLQFSISEELKS